MKNKGIGSYSPNVKYPPIDPMKSTLGKSFTLLRVDSIFPWERSSISPLQSRKEKRLPFCVLGSFPLGLFPSAAPASVKLPSCWGRCWSSPVLHTDTSGQISLQHLYFFWDGNQTQSPALLSLGSSMPGASAGLIPVPWLQILFIYCDTTSKEMSGI